MDLAQPWIILSPAIIQFAVVLYFSRASFVPVLTSANILLITLGTLLVTQRPHVDPALLSIFLSTLSFCTALSPLQRWLFHQRPHLDNLIPLQVEYEPASRAKTTIDIVAVHGLGSVPNRAWTYETPQEESRRRRSESSRGYAVSMENTKSNPMWIRDFLPQSFPTARIMVFNHNTMWGAHAIQATLKDHADRLLLELAAVRKTEEEKNRPLVFICYSFGGTLVKQAMVLATEETKHAADKPRHSIRDSAKAFLFLGTPHWGSNLSFIARVIALFGYWDGSSTELLDVMDRNSAENFTINDRFVSYYHDRDITNFFGAVPDRVFGFPLHMAVDQHSSSLLGMKTIVVDKHHRNIQKYKSPDDPAYQSILQQLKRAIQLALSSAESQQSQDPYLSTANEKDIEELLSQAKYSRSHLRTLGLDVYSFGTAIQAAAFRGNSSLLKQLIPFYNNIDVVNGLFGTPLQAAAFAGNHACIYALVQAGVDVNKRGGIFGSALQAAAYAGQWGIVFVLACEGADVQYADSSFGDAASVARPRGYLEAYQLLLKLKYARAWMRLTHVQGQSKPVWLSHSKDCISKAGSLSATPRLRRLVDEYSKYRVYYHQLYKKARI